MTAAVATLMEPRTAPSYWGQTAEVKNVFHIFVGGRWQDEARDHILLPGQIFA